MGVYVELESNFSRGKNGIEEMLFFGKNRRKALKIKEKLRVENPVENVNNSL